jgi:hypothetical protein
VPRPSWSAGAIVATTTALSCFYFFTGGGWNQNAHFDLARAIVERGTVQIDAYHANTGDKSFFGGHYYSNKAPGTAFLAVPVVAATRSVAHLTGWDILDERVLLQQARMATLVTSTIPTAATALILYLIAIRLGASNRAASFGAIVYGLGTPAWAHGTFLWAHALAGCCLFLAFGAILALSRPGGAGRDVRLGMTAGLSAGYAVATEFPAAGVAALLVGFALWLVWDSGRVRALRVLASMAVGALGPLSLLGAYNEAAFGSPFQLSYGWVLGFEGMNQGFSSDLSQG